MKTTAAEIINECHTKGLHLEMVGDGKTIIIGISAVESSGPGDLVFVDKKEYVAIALERKPSAVVTSHGLKNSFNSSFVVFVAPNVTLAHAFLKQKYADRDFNKSGWSGMHPSAVVHETAVVDASTVIEPRVIVGQNARIGKNTRIMAGSVIENDVVIGDETVIHPNVVIGYKCQIGSHVIIFSGTVIGSEGYGFAQDQTRKSYRIPQTGNVVVEDHVRIGSNCSIDRATYHSTRIGRGTKIDNLCHIAHNVEIGEDCLLTAMLCVAGSTKIGNRVITSGQTGFLDHVKVCDDTVFLHRAGVNKDVEKPGAYAGVPLQPLSQYMRNAVVMKDAEELKKRLSALEKKQDT